MRRSSAITIIALGVAVVASDANAKLDLFIDKSVQQIAVLQNGRLLYVWPVSTGLDRSSTPSGVYTPERLERMWFSRAYYNSPMPHAIFFHHGYAIHGSYDITQLGGPASHGCVRLHPQDAAMLFAMVEQEGPGNTTIVVGDGGSPSPAPPRSRDWDDPSRSPPYGREVGLTRGPYYPPGPQAPPYYNDRYAVGPGPWRGDIGPSPMREPYQTNRPPALRRDAQAAVEPTPGRSNSYRPPATTAAAAKPNSKCATCSPSRASDELPNRHVSVSDTARLPPAPLLSAPLPPPPPPSPPPPSASSQPALSLLPSPSLPSQPTAPPAEQQQPSSAYKVLPRSYWAGAAWRWRLKADHGPLGDSSAAPDSQ